MGIAHLGKHDYRAAKTELQRAVQLNPRLPTAQSLYGRTLRLLGEQDAAERAFRKELELNANDFEANLQLGNLRKDAQKFAEASTYLERATTVRPADLTARKLLATVRLQTGRVEEAVRMLETIVKEAPDAVEVHVQLATAYNRLKRTDDARAGARDHRSPERRSAGEATRRQGAPRMRAQVAAVILASATALLSAQSAPPSKPAAQASAPSAKAPAETGCRRRRVRTPGEGGDGSAAGGAVGRGDRPVRQGPQAEAIVRRGPLVPGHGVLHARRLYPLPGGVPQCRAACAEERRGVRVSGSVRIRPEGLRAIAPAPAAVAHPRRGRHAGSRQHRALSRGHSDDAHGAVRTGARDAWRVCRRRQRQSARDRSHGAGDAPHGPAAGRGAAGSP